MKEKTGLALLVISVISALAFCLAARDQASEQQLEAWQKTVQDRSQTLERLQKERRETLLIDTNKNGITLFIGIEENGKVAHAVMRQPNSTISNVQELQFEMEYGAIHEIIINKIRRMRIE